MVTVQSKLPLQAAIRLSFDDATREDFNRLADSFAEHKDAAWKNAVLAGFLAGLYVKKTSPKKLSQFISQLQRYNLADPYRSLEEQPIHDAHSAFCALLVDCKKQESLSSEENFIQIFTALTVRHISASEISKLLKHFLAKKSSEECDINPQPLKLEKQFRDMSILCESGAIEQLRELYPHLTLESKVQRLVFHASILKSLTKMMAGESEKEKINHKKLCDFIEKEQNDAAYLRNLISMLKNTDPSHEIIKKLSSTKELSDFIDVIPQNPYMGFMFGKLQSLYDDRSTLSPPAAGGSLPQSPRKKETWSPS